MSCVRVCVRACVRRTEPRPSGTSSAPVRTSPDVSRQVPPGTRQHRSSREQDDHSVPVALTLSRDKTALVPCVSGSDGGCGTHGVTNVPTATPTDAHRPTHASSAGNQRKTLLYACEQRLCSSQTILVKPPRRDVTAVASQWRRRQNKTSRRAAT